nr:WG repeat-containing protein [Hymenobacter translucens]
MGGEKIGYKNAAGQVVIKPRFDGGNKFVNGYATVCIGGKCGKIDSTGKEIVPLKYRDLGDFYDGLAGASLDGRKYGYINQAGTVVIPFTFGEVGNFSEGRAVAILNGKCALINKKGTLLTPYKYELIEPMQGGIARVRLKNDSRDGAEHSNFWGFINAQGIEITKLDKHGYKSPNLGNGFAIACTAIPEGPSTIKSQHYTYKIGQGYRYTSALIDKTGKAIIPASAGYEFGNWGNDYVIVKRGQAYGVMNLAGQQLLPVNFREITTFEFGPDKKSLAKAFLNETQFFYVDEHFKCVQFDGVKCPEY